MPEPKKTKHFTVGLVGELERLAAAIKAGDFNFSLDIDSVPREEREIARLVGEIVRNFRAVAEYDLVQYQLTDEALGIAHWDMDVRGGDPLKPDNAFTWSREFRHMLGFTDERDFPNILSSWSNRLHPDDKDRVLAAFIAHIDDQSGKTPFNMEYRIAMKNGEYRYFHAFGTTLRNAEGVPLRTAGAVEDISDTISAQKFLEHVMDTLDIYVYLSDPETDEILYVNEKMKSAFSLGDLVKGEKCWNLFRQSQTGRCDFCKKPLLSEKPGEAVFWEDDSIITGKTLYHIDRFINWSDGRMVHMQQSLDISNAMEAHKALKRHEKMLTCINKAALVLLERQEEDFEAAMSEGIGLIADIADIDRMSVFRSTVKPDGLHLSQLYRWRKESGGTTEVLAELTDISISTFLPPPAGKKHWLRVNVLAAL